jgi:uncharacterized membrane protein
MRGALIRLFVALVFVAIGIWLGIFVIPDLVTNLFSGVPSSQRLVILVQTL